MYRYIYMTKLIQTEQKEVYYQKTLKSRFEYNAGVDNKQA